MFNRKNNKKSKKTDSKNQNNINAFRIEQLEPRLLMSATAAEWQAEFSTVESVVSTVDSNLSSNALSGDLNRDIAGLYTVDPNTGTSQLAKLSDLDNVAA